MSRKIIAVGIGLVLLVVTISLVGQTYTAIPRSNKSVTNETVTQDIDNWVQLDAAGNQSAEAYDDEKVYNSSDVLLKEDSDYRWSTDNISIKFLSTQNTSDGSTAKITYNYSVKPEKARNLATTISGFYSIAATAGILMVIVMFLKILTGIGWGGRR